MQTNIEVIEIKIQPSVIDELLIVARNASEASNAATEWCKQNNCILNYLLCRNERSANAADLRTLYYAKISLES
jgi:hypothetical protein